MRVQVREAAGRKVDPVAAHEPVTRRTVGQFPHERMSLDARGTEDCAVGRDVVNDVVAGTGLDAVGMVRKLQDQWKV
jgi:hypothetical protein